MRFQAGMKLTFCQHGSALFRRYTYFRTTDKVHATFKRQAIDDYLNNIAIAQFANRPPSQRFWRNVP